VASFLTKDLLLPGQDGARWFWEHLSDADLANNTLGGTERHPLDSRVRLGDDYPRPIIDHAQARKPAIAVYATLRDVVSE